MFVFITTTGQTAEQSVIKFTFSFQTFPAARRDGSVWKWEN